MREQKGNKMVLLLKILMYHYNAYRFFSLNTGGYGHSHAPEVTDISGNLMGRHISRKKH